MRKVFLLFFALFAVSGCTNWKQDMVDTFDLKQEATPAELKELDYTRNVIASAKPHVANLGAFTAGLPQNLVQVQAISQENDLLAGLIPPAQVDKDAALKRAEAAKAAEAQRLAAVQAEEDAKVAQAKADRAAKEADQASRVKAEEEAKVAAAKAERARRDAQGGLANLMEDLGKGKAAVIAVQTQAATVEASKNSDIRQANTVISGLKGTVATLTDKVNNNSINSLVLLWGGAGVTMCFIAVGLAIAKVYLPLIPSDAPAICGAAGVGLGCMARTYAWSGFPYVVSAILVIFVVGLWRGLSNAKKDVVAKVDDQKTVAQTADAHAAFNAALSDAASYTGAEVKKLLASKVEEGVDSFAKLLA